MRNLHALAATLAVLALLAACGTDGAPTAPSLAVAKPKSVLPSTSDHTAKAFIRCEPWSATDPLCRGSHLSDDGPEVRDVITNPDGTETFVYRWVVHVFTSTKSGDVLCTFENGNGINTAQGLRPIPDANGIARIQGGCGFSGAVTKPGPVDSGPREAWLEYSLDSYCGDNPCSFGVFYRKKTTP